MEKIIRTHIPAATGWSVVVPVWDDENVALHFEPVVAWTIESEPGIHDQYFNTAVPVTADQEEHNPVLRRPDGTFFAPFDCYLNDEAAVVNYFKTTRLA